MTKQDARTKGLRLLMDGRLVVKVVDPTSGLIVAECRGDNALYQLGFDPKRSEWRCTCPARTKCSHLWALTTVVLAPASAALLATAESTSPVSQQVQTQSA